MWVMGWAQACVALHPSYPQTPRPPPPQKDTVREKTKRPEPSRPPWMVSHSVEASWRLYICIPAKSSRDRREDSASEVPVPTTGGDERRDGQSGGPGLPPGAAGRFGRSASSRARPLPSAPGPAAIFPSSPHYTTTTPEYLGPGRPAPPRPVQTGPPPGTQDTSALRGEDRESWSAPTPTPTSSAGVSRRSRYPSRPAAGSKRLLGPRKWRRTGAVACARASAPARTRFPQVCLFLPLGALCGALFRQGGNIASKSIFGHRPSPPRSPAPGATAAFQRKLRLTLQVTGTTAHNL